LVEIKKKLENKKNATSRKLREIQKVEVWAFPPQRIEVELQ
jgi:hypothetical protein